MNNDRYLTFALGKGRLANKTLELLEKTGITCEEMKDKNSRKLIFVNEELKLRFFLAKGPDVPTYVEYGAADIGVVGSDTIMEENRRVYEVLDLGFGKCRMCVCGPAQARELLKHHERIRVASKYPNIAKDYFFNKKHQTVDIIKLNGSVELGPIAVSYTHLFLFHYRKRKRRKLPVKQKHFPEFHWIFPCQLQKFGLKKAP